MSFLQLLFQTPLLLYYLATYRLPFLPYLISLFSSSDSSYFCS